MVVWKPWRQEPEAAGQSASACRKKRAMEAGLQLAFSSLLSPWDSAIHSQDGESYLSLPNLEAPSQRYLVLDVLGGPRSCQIDSQC